MLGAPDEAETAAADRGPGDALRPALDARSIEVTGLDKAFGTTSVLHGVSVSVPAGSMVALLGPSGCGKTTLLRCIAGLERPDTGRVVVGDRPLTDVAAGVHVPPEQRRLGMVFQDWALFPHMTVGANVAYGLPKGADRRARVHEALLMVGLDGLAQRLPGTLSGGQQQRVALARAIAPRPRVLLLDEPFSNLDTVLRVHVRAELHELLVGLGITTIFVTHDQEEAFVLGDQVAVLRDGRIVQQASPAVLYAEPADRWVADFVGEANFLCGVMDRAGDAGDRGSAATAAGAIDVVPAAAVRAGDEVEVLVRPEELNLTAASGPGAAGAVELVEFFGHDTVSVVRLDGGERVKVRHPGPPQADRGAAVTVGFAPRTGPARVYPTDPTS